jgi:putative DNA primase/helicase
MSLSPLSSLSTLGRTLPIAEDIYKLLTNNGLQFRRKGDEFLIKECPFCDSGKDKADNQNKLSVNSETGVFNCFRCNTKGSWSDFLRFFGEPSRPTRFHEPTSSLHSKEKEIIAIWSKSIPLGDSNAETGREYFRKRGLTPPTGLSQIRYINELDHSPSGLKFPALLFGLNSPAGYLIGLQRIYLNQDGSKASTNPNKMSLGKLKGNAIRFDTPDKVLHIAEGPETSLAVREALNEPTWSTVSAIGLKEINIPTSVKTIFIWADKDKSKTGIKAAEELKNKLRLDGKDVTILLPPIELAEDSKGLDWLDILNEYGVNLIQETYEASKKQLEIEFLNTWAVPQDLPILNEEIPPLDPDILPKPLKDWLVDISERMQVPVELPLATALTALGSVLGRRVVIEPKALGDWKVYCNLWGALIAPPSMLKSPIISEVFSPLRLLAREAQERYEEEAKQKRADLIVLEQQIEKTTRDIRHKIEGKDHIKSSLDSLKCELQDLQEKIETLSPKLTRYIVNDSTIEKLGDILRDNPAGVLLLRDELIGFLKSLNKAGHESDRAFYLEGWNANSQYTFDRVSRGTITIPSMCISIFGGIQPAALQQYFSDAFERDSGGDGFFARFQLTVAPELSKEWKNVDRPPNENARAVALKIFKNIVSWGDGKEPVSVSFSSEAQEMFNEWYENLENRLRSDEMVSDAFSAVLGKYRSLMPALALIFEAVVSASQDIKLKDVGADSATNAMILVDLLEAHAKKIYAGSLKPALGAAQALARRIKRGDIVDGTTLRNIRRNEWTLLKNDSQINAGLSILEDCKWIRFEPENRRQGGRYEVIRLNPKLKLRGKS